MKKLLFSAVLLLPAMASAQFWDGSYQGHPAVPRQETRKLYGTYYPLEGYETASQNEYMGQTSYGNKIYTVSASGKKEKSEKSWIDGMKFYGTLRLGQGRAQGFAHGAKKPKGKILSAVFGTYLNNNLRVDGEIVRHTRGKLLSKNVGTQKSSIKYSQYDFGVNGYYDFPIDSKWTPFVGVGAWIVKSKTKGHVANYKTDDINKTRFALSMAGGVAYRISEMFSAEMMARSRYIFGGDGIYNLEALIGLRADF